MKGAQTPIKVHPDEFGLVLKEIREKAGNSAALSFRLKLDQGWSWRQAYYGNPVEIDFWNDSAKSMFLLNYSHLIAKSLKMYSKNSG